MDVFLFYESKFSCTQIPFYMSFYKYTQDKTGAVLAPEVEAVLKYLIQHRGGPYFWLP